MRLVFVVKVFQGIYRPVNIAFLRSIFIGKHYSAGSIRCWANLLLSYRKWISTSLNHRMYQNLLSYVLRN